MLAISTDTPSALGTGSTLFCARGLGHSAPVQTAAQISYVSCRVNKVKRIPIEIFPSRSFLGKRLNREQKRT